MEPASPPFDRRTYSSSLPSCLSLPIYLLRHRVPAAVRVLLRMEKRLSCCCCCCCCCRPPPPLPRYMESARPTSGKTVRALDGVERACVNLNIHTRIRRLTSKSAADNNETLPFVVLLPALPPSILLTYRAAMASYCREWARLRMETSQPLPLSSLPLPGPARASASSASWSSSRSRPRWKRRACALARASFMGAIWKEKEGNRRATTG